MKIAEVAHSALLKEMDKESDASKKAKIQKKVEKAAKAVDQKKEDLEDARSSVMRGRESSRLTKARETPD